MRQRRAKLSPAENLRGGELHEYSQADLRRLFNLPPALIRALGVAGFITRPARGKTRYSFQDLLVLRMAAALKAANIPSGKITAAFTTIRSLLPPGAAMSSLAVAATGSHVAVREGAQVWETHSGQYTLPLLDEPAPSVTAVLARPTKPGSVELAESLFLKACALEETDAAASRAAYIEVLDLHTEHQEARINLGRLLHLSGELAEAERIYRQAKRSSALLSFNLGILLEDLGRDEEGIASYREALALDPHMYDAHFNLARLHEKADRPREALRHLLAYRRHVAMHGD